MDYQNGKIYKLIGDNGLVYYGSTIRTLHIRLNDHLHSTNTTSKLLTNKKIELVENFPCNSRRELELRETWFIENNECVNKYLPVRTKESRIENIKKWNDDNKEHNRTLRNARYEKDRERILEYSKQYHIKNKEHYNAHKRLYAHHKRSHFGQLCNMY